MLAASVVGTIGGLVGFGIVGGVAGRRGSYLRLGMAVVVGACALVASGELFGYPAWDASALLQGAHSGRASAVFGIALLMGPAPLGFVFLMLGLGALALARAQWHEIMGTGPGPVELRLHGLLLHPAETLRASALWCRGVLELPGVALLLASLIVSVGLFRLAESSRYEIAGTWGAAAMAFRLDRTTGEVVPCVPRQQGWEDGARVVECGGPPTKH